MKQILILICLSIVLIGCSSQSSLEERQDADALDTVIFNTVEELVEYSTNILEAEYIQKVPFNDYGTYEYELAVKTQYKGVVDEEIIHTYGSENSFVPDTKYILFLENWESPLYPHRVYVNIVDPYNINMENSNYEGEALKNITTQELTEVIKVTTKDNLNTNTITEKVIEKHESIQDAIKTADHIAMIEVTDFEKHNKYVGNGEIKVLENFKGKVKSGRYNLPVSLENGQKVIAFFKEDKDGDLSLSSRKGSIYTEESKEWNTILESLQ